MAKFLPDRDIRRLIGSVLQGADESLVNPNGIELRLGKHVLFHSTGEDRLLEDGSFLKVSPGETVAISSLESIDFTPSTVRNIFPENMLMALITPTTTLMREGISQATTKIDAGFCGTLNWGLRNGSTKDLILQFAEPMFKLTILLLEPDESPDLSYGQRPKDKYQNTQGIKRSGRNIPADIPKAKIISSSFERLDHKKQLQEAGYPFNHIGTELKDLHGKFEVVSSDVRMMKDDFQQRTSELTTKIDSETKTLSHKIEESKTSVIEKVDISLDKKFRLIAGSTIGFLTIIYSGVMYLQTTALTPSSISFIAAIAGIAVIVTTYFISRK